MVDGCEIDSLPTEDRMVFERLFFEMFGVPRGVYGPVERPGFSDGQETYVNPVVNDDGVTPFLDWC